MMADMLTTKGKFYLTVQHRPSINAWVSFVFTILIGMFLSWHEKATYTFQACICLMAVLLAMWNLETWEDAVFNRRCGTCDMRCTSVFRILMMKRPKERMIFMRDVQRVKIDEGMRTWGRGGRWHIIKLYLQNGTIMPMTIGTWAEYKTTYIHLAQKIRSFLLIQADPDDEVDPTFQQGPESLDHGDEQDDDVEVVRQLFGYIPGLVFQVQMTQVLQSINDFPMGWTDMGQGDIGQDSIAHGNMVPIGFGNFGHFGHHGPEGDLGDFDELDEFLHGHDHGDDDEQDGGYDFDYDLGYDNDYNIDYDIDYNVDYYDDVDYYDTDYEDDEDSEGDDEDGDDIEN